MFKMLALAAALAVVGCAGSPPWTKQGVSPKVAASDYADCRFEGQEATRRDANIDADIMASRGRDWSQTQTLPARQALYGSSRRQADDIVKSCMIAKGYAPGE